WSFRKTAGLPTPATPYAGWEGAEIELRGHFVGHYLSACARAIAQTDDTTLKANADRVVAGIAECQKTLGNGYVSAFPSEFFDRVEAGRAVWAPYYTLHKIILGLWEMHAYAGDAKALAVVRGLVDWVDARCAKLDDAAMQAMLANEFGGMHEALLNVYSSTGKPEHLKLARRFQKRSFLEPLARGDDPLAGIHANTHLPQVIGQCRDHELTGDEGARGIVEHFWRTLWTSHSYATGGSNNGEYWGPANQLANSLTATNQEFCTSYNWEKISRSLLTWSGDSRYADMIERVFYNGIMVSQHPRTGMFIYSMPLRAGLRKEHGGAEDTFTCCYGTGVQEYASLAQNVYFHARDTLYVNLFINSSVRWDSPGGAVKLAQTTALPLAESAMFTIAPERDAEFALAIRVPTWCDGRAAFSVNDERLEAPKEVARGGWMTIRRHWKANDTIRAAFPMSLKIVAINDDPNLCAVMYGPMVLAGLVGAEQLLPGVPTPPITGDKLRPESWMERLPGKLEWRTRGLPSDMTFKPLHTIVDERYGVYFPFGAPGGSRQKAYEQAIANTRERDARTIDRVLIGDNASEHAHAMKSERSATGVFNDLHWRHADKPGFFEYSLRVDASKDNRLSVMYWGSDAGPRVFDILVDGTRVASERLNANADGRFYFEEYAVPRSITDGKPSVVVRFEASPNGGIAGGVFDLRMLLSK
ncbi:MAG: glycoside hydrolase family 127 protein, partial [Phycisphaerae bacterium]|nr:glycoside hydrolase family 127 protein [Phycisphaerae bacterium]